MRLINCYHWRILLLVGLLGISGCKVGFNFSGGGAIDPRLQTLSIETFSNEAAVVVPYLAQEVTQQMQDRFLNQSRLQLVSNNADIQISGAVTRYQVSPVAISGDTRAEQNRLTIAVRVSFVNTIDENESWENTFSKFVDFDATQDFSSIERDQINEVLEQITQDVFTKSVAKW